MIPRPAVGEFAKEELPKAIAVWTAATAPGMPVGPVVGGWPMGEMLQRDREDLLLRTRTI
ncbi:hypothetical protein [Streptomyces humi]